MDIKKINFLKRLSQLTSSLEISNRELAQISGMTPPTLSRWKNTDEMPTKKSLIKIAAATGCSLIWLESGDGKMFEKKETEGFEAIKINKIHKSVVAGKGIGSVNYNYSDNNLSPDVLEIAELMQQYASPALLQNIKAQLLDIKNKLES